MGASQVPIREAPFFFARAPSTVRRWTRLPASVRPYVPEVISVCFREPVSAPPIGNEEEKSVLGGIQRSKN